MDETPNPPTQFDRIETMNDLTGTQRLAEFVSGLTYDAIRADIRESAKLHLLDTIACMLSFSDLPASLAVRRYGELFPAEAHDAATIAHHGGTTTMEVAALINATFAHGFEMDDTDMPSVSHPGSVIIPAALAVAEALGSTGEELITAIVAGYEAMVRVGRAGAGMERRGYHSTAVAGPFGAAAAAASLMRCDAETTAHAFGIAASRAGGIAEYGLTGGLVKRLHPGLAAQSGIQAVRLARCGMTGPTAALEGRRGLIRAITETGNPELLRAPVEPRAVAETGFKLYSCCAGQHTVIDGMRLLMAEHPELRPESVSGIHVLQNEWEAELVGTTKVPRDLISAQYSAAFALGLRLVRGSNAISEYNEVNLHDPDILGIARRVTYEAQDPDEPLRGFAPSVVTVTLTDGRVISKDVPYATGTPHAPLSRSDVEGKFLDLTSAAVPVDTAHRIIDAVGRIEESADAGALARALVVTATERRETE